MTRAAHRRAVHLPDARRRQRLVRKFDNFHVPPVFYQAVRRAPVLSEVCFHRAIQLARGHDVRALADALDLHLQQARGTGADFDDPPCRLYPLEVLAVGAVRAWLELDMPKVDHPLMHGNLGKLRANSPWPQHDLARQLERLG